MITPQDRLEDPLPPRPTAYQLLRELAKEKVRVNPGSDSHYPGNLTGILETNTEPLSCHSEFLHSHGVQSAPGKNTLL
ncbi:hypothetical protein NQZ68_000776 [Dissostichus eleginoides]|nr:hypothetical protein NQZ68_000776 [Dissostichus eleginoides]